MADDDDTIDRRDETAGGALSSDRLWRLIDANLNRLLEGLRVCEDCLRFYHDDESCGLWKRLRSEVWASAWMRDTEQRLRHRDAEADRGFDQHSLHEGRRDHIIDVFFANAQRAKEACRVLEEAAKLIDTAEAARWKTLRYQVYALEKRLGLRLLSSKKGATRIVEQRERDR